MKVEVAVQWLEEGVVEECDGMEVLVVLMMVVDGKEEDKEETRCLLMASAC